MSNEVDELMPGTRVRIRSGRDSSRGIGLVYGHCDGWVQVGFPDGYQDGWHREYLELVAEQSPISAELRQLVVEWRKEQRRLSQPIEPRRTICPAEAALVDAALLIEQQDAPKTAEEVTLQWAVKNNIPAVATQELIDALNTLDEPKARA